MIIKLVLTAIIKTCSLSIHFNELTTFSQHLMFSGNFFHILMAVESNKGTRNKSLALPIISKFKKCNLNECISG